MTAFAGLATISLMMTSAPDARAAEVPESMDSAEIRLALEKLKVLGRVLYVAAHPDDENTGLISYFSNGALYDTAYLSLTRGDGGQNLIGPELGEPLGVIRTQELLAARKLDRGQQFFTRATDFGFSKSSAETLRIWDREKILADTVWAIRSFRPDLIITRFPADDDKTHGHHTASAQLAAEAFSAAADPKRFPEQLKHVQPWQATRLLWNASSFFFRARNLPFDSAGLIPLEAGGYEPLLGKSFPEIAAESRTMHKSQGFGAGIERGERVEYFKFLDGKPVENGQLFSGIDTSWGRAANASRLKGKIEAIISSYDVKQPSASVPALLELRKAIVAVRDEFWVVDKRKEIDRIIAGALGLHLAAVTEKPVVRPGDTVALQLEAINRSPVTVQLKQMRLLNNDAAPLNAALPRDQLITQKTTVQLPPTWPTSQPYWLRERGTVGTFAVPDQTLIGRPENPPPFPVEVTVTVAGEDLVYNLEPRFRKVDRVQGEVTRAVLIAPPVFVDLPRPVFVFPNGQPETVNVRVTSSAEAFEGSLILDAPGGWKIEPASVPLKLDGADRETTCTFTITPPAAAGEAALRAHITSAVGTDRQEAFGRQIIEYPHIEPQILLPRAEARLVRADIANDARRVGYIAGAGDAVPEALREIGAEVHMLADHEIKADDLAPFDAVVLGVRTYNVHAARIGAWFPELLRYAKNGGVVIVQYNTAPGPKPEHFPAPIRLSRDRVTDENAEMRILKPEHPVFNSPNKITAADFNGWVQERGLYFADEWDTAWTPMISSNDPNEKPLEGGLLLAQVEKGWFIYTGYSWFRQLPAGVPGALRLFANMISLGEAPRR